MEKGKLRVNCGESRGPGEESQTCIAPALMLCGTNLPY